MLPCRNYDCPFPNLWQAESRKHVRPAKNIIPMAFQVFPEPLIVVLEVSSNQFSCILHYHNVCRKRDCKFRRAAHQTISLVVSNMISGTARLNPVHGGQVNRTAIEISSASRKG